MNGLVRHPSRRNRAIPLALVAGLVVLSTGGSAHADPAEILIREGVELRKHGKNSEALAKFEGAYQLSHKARAAAQLGLCEFALDHWVLAEEHLRESLTSRSDPWIRNNIKTLEDNLVLVRRNLAQIEVKGKPSNAEVRISDRFVGTMSDSPFWVLPGPSTIVVEATGFRPFKEVVTLAKADRTVVSVVLEPQTIAARRPDLTPTQPGAGVARVNLSEVPMPNPDGHQSGLIGSIQRPSEEQSQASSTWVWFGLGGALVLGVAHVGRTDRNNARDLDFII